MNLPKLDFSVLNSKQQEHATSQQIDFNDEETKQMTLLFEYKLLQLYGSQLGIYSIPQVDNFKIWHSIIFLRFGFYKDSKFKFIVQFSEEFPFEKPSIKFINNVYHPLINSKGYVDMNKLIPSEELDENQMMYTIFKHLSNMFTDKNQLSCRCSFNPEAGMLYCANPSQFMLKVVQSVQDSQLSLTKNEQHSNLIINYSNIEERFELKQQLKRICQQQGQFQQKKQKFMDYLINKSNNRSIY